MKIFNQLTKTQRKDNIKFAFNTLVNNLINGNIDIKFSTKENQNKFNNILKTFKQKKSIRLAKLSIVHNKFIHKELFKLSLAAAICSNYDDNGRPIDDNGRLITESI